MMIGIFLGGGCSSAPQYYNNPYADPRAQREYQEWITEQGQKKKRSDEYLKQEKAWMQTGEEREPIYQGYMEDITQVNQRWQAIRNKDKAIRLQAFRRSLGIFTSADEVKARKGRSIRERKTAFDQVARRKNTIRYQKYLHSRESLINRLNESFELDDDF